MRYEHTQRGGLHWLLFVTAGICAVGGHAVNPEKDGVWVAWLLYGAAALTAILAFCFVRLTVREESDALAVRFGPIPLFRTRIPYAQITKAEPGRSRLIDGWGVHWFPARGWTWNLWGFDCVELVVDGKPMRVGTDDCVGLTAHLHARMAADAAAD